MKKVFCVGFHKTGTSSLTVALRRLGYRVTGPDGAHNPRIADEGPAMVRRLSAEFDAFQDNPWPLFYREMDSMWPGARFILTTRDPDAWLASVVNHFGGKRTPMREWIYGEGRGDPIGHEQIYLDTYNRHNRAVLDHFRHRPSDLLVLSMETGFSWQPLCDFLGHPIPDEPFPHVNRAVERNRWKDWKRMLARTWNG